MQCISLQYISRRTGWVVWSRVSKARTCSRCPLTMHARCKRDLSKKKMQYFWLSSSTRHHNVGFQPLLQGRTSEEMQFLGRGRKINIIFPPCYIIQKGQRTSSLGCPWCTKCCSQAPCLICHQPRLLPLQRRRFVPQCHHSTLATFPIPFVCILSLHRPLTCLLARSTHPCSESKIMMSERANWKAVLRCKIKTAACNHSTHTLLSWQVYRKSNHLARSVIEKKPGRFVLQSPCFACLNKP